MSSSGTVYFDLDAWEYIIDNSIFECEIFVKYLESPSQAEAVAAAFREAMVKHERYVETVGRHIRRLEAELDNSVHPGLNLLSLTTLLCAGVNVEKSNWVSPAVYLSGNGPWQRDDLSDLLLSCGFKIEYEPISADALIFGALDADDEVIRKIANLKVCPPAYSQEIFILGLVRDADPLELLNKEQLTEIASTHQAIQEMLRLGMTWPVAQKPNGLISEQSSDTSLDDFSYPMTLSPQLALVIGQGPLDRKEVVARLWSYIKRNRLQDPVDRRVIVCDSLLCTLFGKQKVSMFEMAGLIGRHLEKF